MIKAVIIDDELATRESLAIMLEKNCSNIHILAFADSISTGIKAIAENKPDLVFLDIQLSDGKGFEILKHFKTIDFKVIFVTAFDKYAVKAFKFSAIDYLLKPVSVNELVDAVDKVESFIESENYKLKLSVLMANMRDKSSKETKKIVLKTHEAYYLVNVKDIIRAEAHGCTTVIHLADGQVLSVSKLIGEFDEMLSDYDFIRPHRSHLVNADFIKVCEKSRNGALILKDATKIPVSINKKEGIIKVLNQL